jgi:CYTH domain-containing protein
MGLEIEKRFLVDLPPDMLLTILESATKVTKLTQYYLTTNPKCTIRVRIVEHVSNPSDARIAWLTIKGVKDAQGRGVKYEYQIPVKDAREFSTLTPFSVVKKRYCIPVCTNLYLESTYATAQLVIELDVFEDEHQGLVIAEVELPDVETKIPQVG